jgi:hypothetical protein
LKNDPSAIHPTANDYKFCPSPKAKFAPYRPIPIHEPQATQQLAVTTRGQIDPQSPHDKKEKFSRGEINSELALDAAAPAGVSVFGGHGGVVLAGRLVELITLVLQERAGAS